jgi:hypothetical protein
MNFADVLVGSLVFSIASGSSLDLTARMGRSLLLQRQERERMEQIDVEMLAGEQNLRKATRQRPSPDPACADPAGLLMALMQGASLSPLPVGLERRLEPIGGRHVRLRISGGGPSLDRQRLFTPTAYGLCAHQPMAQQPLRPAPNSPTPPLEPAP